MTTEVHLQWGFRSSTNIVYCSRATIWEFNRWSCTVLIEFVIFSYLIASNEVLESFEKYEITASTSKQVGMGLIAFYILMLAAIGAVLYAELSKVFSK